MSLGLGTAAISLTSDFPFLITLSQHKTWAFAFSGLMLLLSGGLTHRPGNSCRTDPQLQQACARAQRWNRRIHWTSVII